MGREISIFSDYHQKENNLTNHCGVLFRQIYRESPKQFEELIVSLLPESTSLRVGPVFSQQDKKEFSVPDLLICQEAFSLFFETKIGAWFHEKQLAGHIAQLAKTPGSKVLFCLANSEDDSSKKEFKRLVQQARKLDVIVQFLTFEDLLGQVRELKLSNPLSDTIDEFEQYLDRNDLLPRWRHLLDVVNCGKTMDEIEAGAYMCPNRGGPFSHARARFLGTYQNKAVRSIHEIDALVACGPGGKSFRLQWNNCNDSEAAVLSRAGKMISRISHLHITDLQSGGLQIFLLGAKAPTNFIKDTVGGLMGSHIYFWNITKRLGTESVAEMAKQLQGRNWSDYR